MARTPDIDSIRFSNTDDQAIVTGDGKHIKAANKSLFDLYWGGKQWVTLESKPGVKPKWVTVVPLTHIRFMNLIVQQPEEDSVVFSEAKPLPHQ